MGQAACGASASRGVGIVLGTIVIVEYSRVRHLEVDFIPRGC